MNIIWAWFVLAVSIFILAVLFLLRMSKKTPSKVSKEMEIY